MSTPIDQISDAAAALPAWLEGASAQQRLAMLNDAMDAARELQADAAALRGAAMRAFVDEAGGASAAARALGVSRTQVYNVMSHGA